MINNIVELDKRSLYEKVADNIEKAILDEDITVGEKLPSEAELSKQFSISRNVLREALKLVKERGLITVRVGEGAFVTVPDSKMLGNMVNRMITMNDVGLNYIYEIRFTLEVTSCGFAARRADCENLKEIDKIINDMDKDIKDEHRWAELDLKFHMAIVKASKNPLLYYYIQPLTDALSELFCKGYKVKGAVSEGVKGHKDIVEAIKRKDSKMAREAMKKHLDRSVFDLNVHDSYLD